MVDPHRASDGRQEARPGVFILAIGSKLRGCDVVHTRPAILGSKRWRTAQALYMAARLVHEVRCTLAFSIVRETQHPATIQACICGFARPQSTVLDHADHD